MTVTQEVNEPIHLAESERFPYATHGTLSPAASLTTTHVWFVSSHGGLTRPPAEQNWLSGAVQDIIRWLNEPVNWDGFGAKQISPVVAKQVFALLRRFAALNVPRPFITGTTDGGLNLQWESPRYDLQIVVGVDDAVGFYWDKQADIQWEGSLERATLLADALSALALE